MQGCLKDSKHLHEGAVIGYLGDLGAGKTAFTTGLVKGLGIDGREVQGCLKDYTVF